MHTQKDKWWLDACDILCQSSHFAARSSCEGFHCQPARGMVSIETSRLFINARNTLRNTLIGHIEIRNKIRIQTRRIQTRKVMIVINKQLLSFIIEMRTLFNFVRGTTFANHILPRDSGTSSKPFSISRKCEPSLDSLERAMRLTSSEDKLFLEK